MAYSAMQIANAFVQKAKAGQLDKLTPMKLQKLMFFAQSWYIRTYRKKLIDDNFVRWQYGPVIPSIYYEFAQYGSNEITSPANDYRGEVKVELTASDNDFIDEVIKVYGQFDGWKLSVMTHQPKTAWSMGEIGTVITVSEMFNGVV